jgi:hypothetical protein
MDFLKVGETARFQLYEQAAPELRRRMRNYVLVTALT